MKFQDFSKLDTDKFDKMMIDIVQRNTQCIGKIGNWNVDVKSEFIELVQKRYPDIDCSNCLVNYFEKNYTPLQAIKARGDDVDEAIKTCMCTV